MHAVGFTLSELSAALFPQMLNDCAVLSQRLKISGDDSEAMSSRRADLLTYWRGYGLVYGMQ